MTLGKEFERRFANNFNNIPGVFCYRLNDQVSGYKGSSNIADFICYSYPDIFLIDCKTHAGNTISFGDFSQYDKMIQYSNVKGLHAGTVVFFYDHDKVLWIPIETWQKLAFEGKKSFSIKYIDQYECIDLPGKKKVKYLDTDYSTLVNYYKERT